MTPSIQLTPDTEHRLDSDEGVNAERLLIHFDRIADAPDAVPRLRRFILDLAVRGRLVPQDPNDEPASELVKRISAEKARLVKAGEIRKPKAIPALTEEDLPFLLPANWRWSQLAESGALSPRNEAADDTQASFVPMPMIAAEYGVTSGHEVRLWKDIKKGYTHFAEGDVGLAKITPCFQNGKSAVFRNLTGGLGSGTTELHIVRPLLVNPDFVLLFLKCPYFIEAGIPKMTGTAGQKRVPAEYFANSPFPLPPLAEQHRIVAKVDELMALCDRLEAARTERETTRNRLAATSLARLNAPDPDPAAFRKDAAFTLDNLTPLTARSDQIKALRQTILNLAVRGKLVAQDPSDEPAIELLGRIALEGEPKKRSTKPTIESDGSIQEISLAPGWVTTTLETVCVSIVDGDHIPPPKTKTGIPFLVIGDVRNQTIEFTGSRFVSSDYFNALNSNRRPRRGDLLYTLVGSYGIPVVVRSDQPFCVQRHIGILRPTKFIDVDFLARAMESHLVFAQATACATGIAQKTVPLSGLRRLLIPLPPLAEQRRIVAKVDELMALCNRLEASLTTGDETREGLLESTLHEALESGGQTAAY